MHFNVNNVSFDIITYSCLGSKYLMMTYITIKSSRITVARNWYQLSHIKFEIIFLSDVIIKIFYLEIFIAYLQDCLILSRVVACSCDSLLFVTLIDSRLLLWPAIRCPEYKNIICEHKYPYFVSIFTFSQLPSNWFPTLKFLVLVEKVYILKFLRQISFFSRQSRWTF